MSAPPSKIVVHHAIIFSACEDGVKFAVTDENPINWEYNSFFTFTPGFDNEALDNMSLTDEQFQNIGAAVVARLLALNGRGK